MKVEKISAFSFENTGGNPAGVVFSDKMLSDNEMLKIAKDVNYSETAFLVKQDEHSFRIRYFSPKTEIAFCGHATIASGYSIAKKFGLGKYELLLNDGSVEVEIKKDDNKYLTSITSMKTHTKDASDDIQKEVFEIFNFSQSDIAPNYPIKLSYSGNYHLIIFLKDKSNLEKMEYDFQKAQGFMQENQITTISLLYKETENLFHSRNAFAFGGVYEDPATGSAAIALAEYLRNTKIKTSGSLEILQGFDMKQPSKLYVNYKNEENSEVELFGESREIKD